MKRRIISRLLAVAMSSTFCALCTIAATPADKPASDHALVMISVDGLAGYYLDDPAAEMPMIRQLAAEGSRASSMKAATPTVTWPNHTTLVTGDNPARHGVVGNNYYDRVTGKAVRLIFDPIYDKDQIVKVPTLYDLAAQAGLKTAAFRWPATRNAKSLNWTMPNVDDEKLAAKYSTPGLMEAYAQAATDLRQRGEPASEDDVLTEVFNQVLREDRPNLALLHLSMVDHIEHASGPRSPEAYAAIKDADRQVRSVWEELQRDFPSRFTLFIVSDHGFSPIEQHIPIRAILSEAGLLNLDKSLPSEVAVVLQGGAALVYILNPEHREAVTAKVRAAFATVEGVAKVVDTEHLHDYGVADPKTDPHAPDLILFADEGSVFGDTSAGTVSAKDKPESKGSHGQDSSLPDLHATFVIWGEGVVPGVKLGEISNLDVAPTIAQLLGLALPEPDGKPLTAVLAK